MKNLNVIYVFFNHMSNLRLHFSRNVLKMSVGINFCVINYVQLTIFTQQNESSAAIKNSKGGQRRDGVGEEEEEEEKRERPKLDLIIARCDKLNFTRKL